MVVASHNQTATSYLYMLQILVTFTGLPHFKNESQFFVTQTHHPIPALAHKECGVKASRMDKYPKITLGAGRQTTRGMEVHQAITEG